MESFVRFSRNVVTIILATGVLTNAIYIFGQGYSRGFVSGLGFDYILFTTSWDEAPFWAYEASRMMGLYVVQIFLDVGWILYLYISLSVLLVIITFRVISTYLSKTNKSFDKDKIRNSINPEVGFFILSFSYSYLVTVAVFFVPIIVSVWVLFPYFAEKYGASVAFDRYSQYEKSLCDTKYGWSGCIHIDSKYFPDYTGQDKILGRVVLKNDQYWGVLTENGPMTISAPDSIFYESIPLKKTED
ncbi:hypothetical protein [Neptunomonas japonica]|uniref:hypothetical protein n=1 Tax=Neptunomonas japonica TaxID=417574 RepID=UPI0019169380|nr:hypothetical protein [Neptunomonas japonica]